MQWSQSKTKLSFHKKSIFRWKYLSSLNSREKVVIIRIHFGHILLTHRHLFTGIRESPLCTYCHTTTHTIKYILYQRQIFNNTYESVKLTSIPFLIAHNLQSIHNVLHFLRHSHLFSKIQLYPYSGVKSSSCERHSYKLYKKKI